MQAIIIVLLVLAVLLVIFTLQNITEISIHFFFWELANVPLVLLVLGCVIVGYLLASVYFYPRIWQLKKESRRLAKSNKELEKNQPIEFSPEIESPDENHPEGIELEDDDKGFWFFK